MFYHSLDFPDGESVAGHWDIRGRFAEYIGRYPLAGKTVLDVGTASGFLAFSAEASGAQVTALDLDDLTTVDRLPFRDSAYYRDPSAWATARRAQWLEPLKQGFWYAWHKLGSRCQVVYAPLPALSYTERRFDVVIAGAIIEHLADPVGALGKFARVANEAVLIAFTDVDDSRDLEMRAMNDWRNPQFDYTWWKLSSGLYRRVFENMGFRVEFTRSAAVNNPNPNNTLSKPVEIRRSTIIARRH